MMLGRWSISVGNPWWLILIPLIIPPLVWMSYRSLAGLGPVRRTLAIFLRASVITLIVLALAQVQSVRITDRLTTMFLIDASNSIPKSNQKAALDYATEASKKRRRDDMAGVVVFGREPRVEVPPQPSELNLLGIENTIDTENTDLAAAVKLALATFPEDTARRHRGRSPTATRTAATCWSRPSPAKDLGVQIDVLPIEYFYDREVLVEKVSIPPDVKKGETVNINVVIRASEPTRGTLQIFQKSDNYRAPAAGNEQPVPVELDRGINVLTLQQLITEPNFYTFTAEFIPDEGSGDQPRDQQPWPRGSPTRGARRRSS